MTDYRTLDFRRINVVGVSGSGKSTISQQLADGLRVPRIEMDRLWWKPQWTESTESELRSKLREAIRPDRLVLDGNYHSKTQDIKWTKATLVVWVDRGFFRTLWQVSRRAVARSISGTEIWPGTGNCESLRSTLSSESIVWWMIQSYVPVRRRYAEIARQIEHDDHDGKWSHLKFVRLRSDHDVSRLLDAATQFAATHPATSENCHED